MWTSLVDTEVLLYITMLYNGKTARDEFKLHKGYPVLVNDAQVNEWMRQVTRELVGEEAVVESPGGMGAEDFSYMAQAAPGAMFNLGAQVPNGGGHHTPTFDISEEVFPIGAAVMAETARRFVTGQLA